MKIRRYTEYADDDQALKNMAMWINLSFPKQEC